MERTLLLNDTDIRSNPIVWSHDPSMMWDPVSKKYYSYSTDVYRPEFGLCEKRGIPLQRDLIGRIYISYQKKEQFVHGVGIGIEIANKN